MAKEVEIMDKQAASVGRKRFLDKLTIDRKAQLSNDGIFGCEITDLLNAGQNGCSRRLWYRKTGKLAYDELPTGSIMPTLMLRAISLVAQELEWEVNVNTNGIGRNGAAISYPDVLVATDGGKGVTDRKKTGAYKHLWNPGMIKIVELDEYLEKKYLGLDWTDVVEAHHYMLGRRGGKAKSDRCAMIYYNLKLDEANCRMVYWEEGTGTELKGDEEEFWKWVSRNRMPSARRSDKCIRCPGKGLCMVDEAATGGDICTPLDEYNPKNPAEKLVAAYNACLDVRERLDRVAMFMERALS